MTDPGASNNERQNPEALWEQRKRTVLKTIYFCETPSVSFRKRRWNGSLARALNDRALQALLRTAAVRKDLGERE